MEKKFIDMASVITTSISVLKKADFSDKEITFAIAKYLMQIETELKSEPVISEITDKKEIKDICLKDIDDKFNCLITMSNVIRKRGHFPKYLKLQLMFSADHIQHARHEVLGMDIKESFYKLKYLIESQ